MTLSRSSVVAMTRGVYWPLATWIATSSEPNVKTTKERLSVMTVLAERLGSVNSELEPSPARVRLDHLDDGPEHSLRHPSKDRNDPER